MKPCSSRVISSRGWAVLACPESGDTGQANRDTWMRSPPACTQSPACNSSHRRALLSRGLQWQRLCLQGDRLATGQRGRLQLHKQQTIIACAARTAQMHVITLQSSAQSGPWQLR